MFTYHVPFVIPFGQSCMSEEDQDERNGDQHVLESFGLSLYDTEITLFTNKLVRNVVVPFK